MRSSQIGLVIAAVFAVTACVYRSDDHTHTNRTVSIMSFNVENLFDSEHDAGKDDYTYLPLAAKQNEGHRARCAEIPVDRWREQCLEWDWNEDVVRDKLRGVAAAILQVNDGRGPDIIALQEVENAAIIERLRREYLGAAGYRPVILIEGNDKRGIDVAFLSRLEIDGAARLHEVPFAKIDTRQRNDTRGILEATFRLPDGELFTGYAVHFPAPFHPYGLRIESYQFLNQLVDALPPGRMAFAAGDFNTPAAEDAEHNLLTTYAESHWQIAHEVTCDDCRGTYYYAPKDEWSFLDMILISPGLAVASHDGWSLHRTSIANNAAGQRRADGTPAGFRLPGRIGVSDHWPLVVELQRAHQP